MFSCINNVNECIACQRKWKRLLKQARRSNFLHSLLFLSHRRTARCQTVGALVDGVDCFVDVSTRVAHCSRSSHHRHSYRWCSSHRGDVDRYQRANRMCCSPASFVLLFVVNKNHTAHQRHVLFSGDAPVRGCCAVQTYTFLSSTPTLAKHLFCMCARFFYSFCLLLASCNCGRTAPFFAAHFPRT